MKLAFEPIEDTTYSDTVMEDCIACDLGINWSKSDFNNILAENQVKNNWKSLVSFGYTNDGLHIEDLEAKGNMDHPGYCIVYVSFGKVISSLEVIQTEIGTIEMWDAINKAIANYFKLELV